ncbi:DHH family phosphoesterase [Bacillus chungangensis]|uniref:Cyclic-di-AMP phosphodiesterase n=1 Tax=Bacillus chungangensis TaxID=587633 RepID=A0ABT9WSL2_9BACI|nr:DHH family phosphoesterase [Bacillus chungangensis]MDQ0176287.1 c-di-AMP phosphodiesterase-like protein [Bacillus chungangensis]
MPTFVEKRMLRYSLYGLMAVSCVLLIVIYFFYWWMTVIGIVVLSGLFYMLFYAEQKIHLEMEHYITTLSHRINKVGEEAVMNLPVGIMLLNDHLDIEWANPYMISCFKVSTLIGRSLYEVGEPLVPVVKNDVDTEIITLHKRKFRTIFKREEKLLYLFDVTEQREIETRYQEERTVIAIIYLDNYDEWTQGMDDQTKSSLNSLVTSMLINWAQAHDLFLKRVSSDRFIAVLKEKTLRELEKNKFSILDAVRETTAKQNVPLTLSIGIGCEVASLPELGALAQSSLDLALGRGGDQVAIKRPSGKVQFYGGKTNPMEKRTRVRARVISHALKELMIQSDKVFVMGHKFPDMDAIGAAIGIRKVAQMNQKEGYIVLNFDELNKGVERLVEKTKQYPELYSRIITPEEAFNIVTENTLIVVVDTHKPSMVMEERLLGKVNHVVVIDHHRRGEEFIQNPVLVYMEPYASSTAELVTELLEYQPKHDKINMLEATALLAGIIVDTKSFTLRTGSRTFDAASYLRSFGADTVLIQQFLKEDIKTFMKRAALIETVAFYREGIAIAKGDNKTIYHPVMIAQAADTLLSMDRVSASFVISKREENVVGISARSLGEINVQIIMETLGGGGHLSNAAVQLKDITIEEAELQLQQAIEDYVEGGKKE